MLVIARAYGDEPLVRVLTGCRSGLAYVINPDLAADGKPAEFSGVGFPDDSVFQYEPSLAESLSSAWVRGDCVSLARFWREASPLMVRA